MENEKELRNELKKEVRHEFCRELLAYTLILLFVFFLSAMFNMTAHASESSDFVPTSVDFERALSQVKVREGDKLNGLSYVIGYYSPSEQRYYFAMNDTGFQGTLRVPFIKSLGSGTHVSIDASGGGHCHSGIGLGDIFEYNIQWSNHDVMNMDDPTEVFFQQPHLLRVAMALPIAVQTQLQTIVPVAVCCLAYLIGCLILPRVLRKFQRRL